MQVFSPGNSAAHGSLSRQHPEAPTAPQHSPPWCTQARCSRSLPAGGWPAHCHPLLRGAPTSDSARDADRLSSAISKQAGEVLTALLFIEAVQAKVAFGGNHVPPLLDAFRDAPDFWARASAANALLMIAEAQPLRRMAMAHSGLMGMLLRFYIESEDLRCGPEGAEPAWTLGRMLVHLDRVAMRDLREAICGPDADVAFCALCTLLVCPPAPSVSWCVCTVYKWMLYLCKRERERERE
jgi:hypothetical protein